MKHKTTWNHIFQKEGQVFTEPHEDMASIVEILKKRGAEKILDLGSGSGRHIVYLAQNGFSVFGLDNSATGMDMTRKWLAKENLSAELVQQEMTDAFPWSSNFFDAVISVQVIHHADTAIIKKIISEIERTLKKDGLIFITVPTLKNQGEKFKQIEQNTFVPLNGREKGLPHHYFTPEELKDFFSNFDVTDIHIDKKNHYCLLAFKR